MKIKFLACVLLLSTLAMPASATSWGRRAGYQYFDGGGIYTDTTLPFSVPTKIEDLQKNIAPTTNKPNNLEQLKKGTSTKTNVFGLVEWGNAGIMKAAKDGRISKISYVQTTTEKLFVPLLIIPVYMDRYTTTVYGE